jgi:hypothetical protein
MNERLSHLRASAVGGIALLMLGLGASSATAQGTYDSYAPPPAETKPPAPKLPEADPPGIMSPRVSLRPLFGLDGRVEVNGGPQADLDTTYGGALEIEVPALPVLSFAAEIAVMAWRPAVQHDMKRNIMTSISLIPRLRIPFGGGVDPMHGAIYVGAPFGMSTSSLSDDYREDIAGGHVDAGVGCNYGGRAGVQIFLTPRFGVTADIEYRVHRMQHRLDMVAASGGEIEMNLRQLLLYAGLVFAL